jgi:hypothetical protein
LALDQYTAVAVLKFEDLCDLLKTIADDTETIMALRQGHSLQNTADRIRKITGE